MRSSSTIAVALALLASPAIARGHDFWIERQKGAFVLHAGHPDAPTPVEPAKVTSIRCVQEARPPADVRARAVQDGAALRVDASCEVATAALDHGFWSLTPDGEVNRPRSQVPDTVKAWQARAYAKWVDAGSVAAVQPVAAELEIVPVKPLSGVRHGDKITLRVLASGVAVPGAVVEVGHRAVGETDSAGEIRVRVREAGLQILSASVRRPLKSADADALVLEASLAFEVTR